MSKKIIKLTILIFVLSLIGFLSYKVFTKTQEKKAIANSIKTIPEFSFTTLGNSVFSRNNLNSNLQTIFIYLNSECEFCQHEAHSISESTDEFNDIQLVFISTEPIEKIKAFSEKHNLNNKENIIFLNDKSNNFSTLFSATSIPFILIYDKEQNLIKAHKGQLNAKEMLRIINK